MTFMAVQGRHERGKECNEPALHHLRGKGSNVGGGVLDLQVKIGQSAGCSLGRLQGAPTTHCTEIEVWVAVKRTNLMVRLD